MQTCTPRTNLTRSIIVKYQPNPLTLTLNPEQDKFDKEYQREDEESVSAEVCQVNVGLFSRTISFASIVGLF